MQQWDVACFDSLNKQNMVDSQDVRINEDLNAQVLSGADAVLLCYAANDYISLVNLKTWYSNISVYLDSNTTIYLVETKSDLNSKISSKDIDNLSKYLRFKSYVKTSAATGDNVHNLFRTVVTNIEKTRASHNDNSTISEIVTPQVKTRKRQGSQMLQHDNDSKHPLNEGMYTKRFTVADDANTSENMLIPKRAGTSPLELSLDEIEVN